MPSLIAHLKRLYWAFISPPVVARATDVKPIKFGTLGAANIVPLALVFPAKSHPEVVVYAVAARDKSKAETFAKKHGIEKAYGGPNGYQELLDDPEVEVVYNPLPNGLHYEWTMKALAAGKHVLLEKPASNTAEEARRMFELAESKGLLLLEAFHYRFHPAIQRVKAIISSGELGSVKSITTKLSTTLQFKKDDIRYKYELGGGSAMDMGCYTISVLRYLLGANPTSVLSATPTPYIPPGSPPSFEPKVDRAMNVTLTFPNDIIATIMTDLDLPLTFGFIPKIPPASVEVECEGGTIHITNFVLPTLYHSVKIIKKSGKKTESRLETIYTFADGQLEGKDEVWWLTYRYQLEAFVDKLRGRKPQTWVEKEDTIANMEWIEKVYEKSGLGIRPQSEYVLPQLSES